MWVSLPDGIEAKGNIVYLFAVIIVLNIAAILDECKKEHNIKFHIGPKYVCSHYGQYISCSLQVFSQ